MNHDFLTGRKRKFRGSIKRVVNHIAKYLSRTIRSNEAATAASKISQITRNISAPKSGNCIRIRVQPRVAITCSAAGEAHTRWLLPLSKDLFPMPDSAQDHLLVLLVLRGVHAGVEAVLVHHPPRRNPSALLALGRIVDVHKELETPPTPCDGPPVYT
ncbi:unnamed protein product [Musa acuminata subsp. burmannicoides]